MSGLLGWVDEIQAWSPPAPPPEARADLQHDIRRLQLIQQAKDSGASWAAIGATLGGITGKQAKRDARRLAARVQRELLAAKRAG